MAYEKIAFVASGSPRAQEAGKDLRKRYGGVNPDEAEVVVALGGDGFMLETLHDFMNRDVPIYGMNRGTVGFLMNEYREDDLVDHLNQAAVDSGQVLAKFVEAHLRWLCFDAMS